MPFTVDDYRFQLHGFGSNNAIFQKADESIETETDSYYGYLSIDGFFVIVKKTVEGAYTYYTGTSDYDTYWAIKGLLEYKTYDLIKG